jgi:hypothetical protein
MALTATDFFNDATTRLVGGIGPDQVSAVVSDLIGVQNALNAAFPTMSDLTGLHAHVIINQLNEEIAAVQNINAGPNAVTQGAMLGDQIGKAINDIHRDIIDIAQGDTALQAQFNPTPLPALNAPATPFHDNADQTAFLTQYIHDANSFARKAADAFAEKDDIAALVTSIQQFQANASSFSDSQGGLYSARFGNELRTDGTNGTAVNAIIEGLQTNNQNEVITGVNQLVTNTADVAGNNRMADGGTFDAVVAAEQALTAPVIAAQTPGAAGAGQMAGGAGAGGAMGTGAGTGQMAGGAAAGGATGAAGNGATHTHHHQHHHGAHSQVAAVDKSHTNVDHSHMDMSQTHVDHSHAHMSQTHMDHSLAHIHYMWG